MTVSPRGLTYNPDDPSKNFFELNLFLEDGDQNNTYKVSIEVPDLDENPPVIKSGKSQARHDVSILENQLIVYEVIAEDIEKENLDYTLYPSVKDNDLFEFESQQDGLLRFKAAPNFEYPLSINQNNTYEVLINVSDGLNETEQLLTVTVLDGNDPPTLQKTSFSLEEDYSFFSFPLDITDEDEDVVSAFIYEPTEDGNVTLLDNEVFYVPDENFNGTDKMVISLNDGKEEFYVEVHLNVIPVNDLPVAVDDFAYFYSLTRQHKQSISINVKANDHTGPDATAEKVSYQIGGVGTADVYGNYKSKNGAEISLNADDTFYYSPPLDFIGEDNFQYLLKDGNLSAIGNVKVWVAKSVSSPEWTSLYYFGTYYQDPADNSPNWIFHTDLGWVFILEPDKILDSTWMWRENLGWFWTGDKYFQWVFHDEFQQWLHWERGINSTSGWFLRDAQDEVFYEQDFVRFRLIKDINEILPNIEKLSSFVQSSNFFSRTEVVNIVLELNRYKKSTTLDKILEFDFSY
jgi:hypothetical protein